MTYYIDSLQIAVHGKAGVLRSLDFAPALREARDKDCDWVNDNLLEKSIKAYQKAQKKLANLPEDAITTLEIENNRSGSAADLNCLELFFDAHPELRAAAVAKIRNEYEFSSFIAYYTFWNEEDTGIHAGPELDDGHQLLPSVLELKDRTRKVHAFTFKSLAETLRQNTPELASMVDFPPEELEERLEEWISEGAPYAFHVCLSPEGTLRLGAYQRMQNPKQARIVMNFEEGDAEQEELLALYQTIFQKDGLRLVEEGEGRNYYYSVLDGTGNEYFLHWAWQLRTAPSDWGFPEDWDWVPFDRKLYFSLPTWDEEDFYEEDY